MKKWQIYSLLVTIIIFIFGLAGSGWFQRPIIDYYIDDLLDDVSFQYEPLSVSLKIRNRGNIDAALALIVTVINAHITVDKIEPWIKYNETQVRFHISALSHMEDYSSYRIKISPVADPQNFTITYTFEDISNFWAIPNGMISHLFLESHGYFPTYVMYNRTNTNVYQWLK
jgi:hypothetical protein